MKTYLNNSFNDWPIYVFLVKALSKQNTTVEKEIKCRSVVSVRSLCAFIHARSTRLVLSLGTTSQYDVVQLLLYWALYDTYKPSTDYTYKPSTNYT